MPSAAGGDVYSTLATGAQTAGGYFLTHAIVPPGGGPPPHIHTREEEAFYIVRGDLSFLLGDEEVEASGAPLCTCLAAGSTSFATRRTGRSR